jgi:hypothetical protein
VHGIQQTFCGSVKKFCIIVTKNAVLLNLFFNALKIAWQGGFKSLNAGRRESVKDRKVWYELVQKTKTHKGL